MKLKECVTLLMKLLWVVSLIFFSGDVANAQNQWNTPSGPPAVGVVQMCLNSSGLSVPVSSGTCSNQNLIICNNHTYLHITSATDTLVVQGVTSQTVYVCGEEGHAAGTATYYLENTASTNANCSSTLTQIDGLHSVIANSDAGFYNSIWGGLKNTSGNGLCINSTGTGGVDVDVWFSQF